MDNYIIQTNNIIKRYRNWRQLLSRKDADHKWFTALNGLSCNIPKGAIYGLVGKNGAGKTTLIRVLSGLQDPTEGSYTINGIPHNSKDITNIRASLGTIIEGPALVPTYTAKQNVMYQYMLLGENGEGKADEILDYVGLGNTGNKPAKDFSLGMRQRLGLALTLIGDPQILLLDEPINGLDPEGIVEIRNLILRMNEEKGLTILMSSHILEELSKIATHYGFISHGRIIREMSREQLIHETSTKRVIHTNLNAEMALEELSIGFEIGGERTYCVKTEASVTELAMSLYNKGITIETMTENTTSLEDYFIGLIGEGD